MASPIQKTKPAETNALVSIVSPIFEGLLPAVVPAVIIDTFVHIGNVVSNAYTLRKLKTVKLPDEEVVLTKDQIKISDGFRTAVEEILESGAFAAPEQKPMMDFMRQLLKIAAAGEGTITEELLAQELDLEGTNLVTGLPRSGEAFDHWKIMVRKVRTAVDVYIASLISASEEPAVARQIIDEAPTSPFKIAATRAEMVEEILDVANAGYLERDMKRAEGALKSFTDIFSWLIRKPTEKIIGEDLSTVGLWREYAKQCAFDRGQTFSEFHLRLEKTIPASGYFADEEAAMTATIGSASGLDLDELPLEHIAKLLSVKRGDVYGLASALADTADRFGDLWNWVVEDYIQKQLEDTAVLSYPGSTSILNRAHTARKNIRGNPENFNPVLAEIFPHFWQYDDLPKEQRYQLGEAVVTWLLPLGGASKTYGVLARIPNAFGRSSMRLLVRVPRLNKLISLTAQTHPEAIEVLQKTVLAHIQKGEQISESMLRELARKDPAFLLRTRGIGRLPPEIARTAQQTLEVLAEKLGSRAERIASKFAGAGKWSWKYLVNPPRKVARALALGLGITAHVTGKGFSILFPRTGQVIANAASRSGRFIAAEGSAVTGWFKGAFVTWVGLQNFCDGCVLDPTKAVLDHPAIPEFERRGDLVQAAFTTLSQENYDDEEKRIEMSESYLFDENGAPIRTVTESVLEAEISNAVTLMTEGNKNFIVIAMGKTGDGSGNINWNDIEDDIINNPIMAEYGVAYKGPHHTRNKLTSFGRTDEDVVAKTDLELIDTRRYLEIREAAKDHQTEASSDLMNSLPPLTFPPDDPRLRDFISSGVRGRGAGLPLLQTASVQYQLRDINGHVVLVVATNRALEEINSILEEGL